MRRKVVPYHATASHLDAYLAPETFNGSRYFGEPYQRPPVRKKTPPSYSELPLNDFSSALPVPTFFYPDVYRAANLCRRRSVMVQAQGYLRNDPPAAFPDYGGDSVWFYLTGAASHAGTQTDDNLSLGGYRSSTEADRVGRLISFATSNVRIVQASRYNGTDGDVGTLNVVDEDSVSYTAPDSTTPGESRSIPNGGTEVVTDGENASKWVRVTRTSANEITGSGMVEFVDQFNNVFGMKNAEEAESSGGGDKYRAVMAQNVTLTNVTGLTFWIGTLGPSAVTSAAQLSGSGSGTITGATDCFIGWPSKGWARIQSSGGTLKEIVYYSSRTATSLTVPSLGRGRLGTSATAGAASDVAYPVPGIRIAYEAASPATTGSVQTIADESTAPTGVTWKTGVTSATGTTAASLVAGGMGAVWIHRELPAGVSAIAKALNSIECQFVVNNVTYRETLAGMYRIADDDLARYEFFVGVDGMPDLTGTPDATASPPDPPTNLNLPYAAGHTYYVVVQKRNQHDLVSAATTQIVYVNGSGVQTTPPPSMPEIVSFEATASGAFLLRAVYYYLADTTAQQGNQWLIYLRTNGTNPDPSVDTPTTATLVKGTGWAYLEYTTSTYTAGTVGKVLVRVRRTGTPNFDSASSDIFTATSATAGPSTPTGGIFWRDVAEQEQD